MLLWHRSHSIRKKLRGNGGKVRASMGSLLRCFEDLIVGDGADKVCRLL